MAVISGLLGAIINLNHPGRFLSWGWFQISLANLIVIILMVVVFVLALVVPFPGKGRRRGDS
jgi:hypothetical protein